jgi:hypothetical protein
MAVFTNAVFPAAGEAGDGGGVIQHEYYVYKDVRVISTGGNYTVIPYWDATITPQDSSSRILITAWLDWGGGSSRYTVGARLYYAGGAGSDVHISAADGSTGHYGSNTHGVFMAGGHQNWSNYGRSGNSAIYLHQPNTTQTLHYRLYVNEARDNSNVYINRYYYQTNADYMNYATSGMLLQEVSS